MKQSARKLFFFKKKRKDKSPLYRPHPWIWRSLLLSSGAYPTVTLKSTGLKSIGSNLGNKIDTNIVRSKHYVLPRSKHSIYLSTEILVTFRWGTTGDDNSKKWNGKFLSNSANRSTTFTAGSLFSRKQPPGTEHSYLDQNARKFCHSGKQVLAGAKLIGPDDFICAVLKGN